MKRIENILRCLECKDDLKYNNNSFICDNCKSRYPVVDSIPRFVSESFYNLDAGRTDIEERTKNYFGFEWDYFKDWGFVPDEDVPKAKENEFIEGTVSSRKKAFDSKCRMTYEDLTDDKIVLDAGCGNGRYTYEAASRGKALIIGVDIGYGAVKSAFENNKKNYNVIIIQASLFNLPFKNNVFDSCFSNGVLMHTGDAEKAFYEIAHTIKRKGVFAVHLYHKLNPVWEFNDKLIRSITTRLDIEKNLKLATILANFARIVNKIPYALRVANIFLRLQRTKHHMYDWYSAPIATHHTFDELAGWFYKNGFIVDDKIPKLRSIFSRPWGFNLKGIKKFIA